MRKQMIAYFESIGELEMTMTPDEVLRYRAAQTMKMGLKRVVHKWRWWKLLTTSTTVMTKFWKAWKSRYRLDWALEKPLNLGEVPVFRFVKE